MFSNLYKILFSSILVESHMSCPRINLHFGPTNDMKRSLIYYFPKTLFSNFPELLLLEILEVREREEIANICVNQVNVDTVTHYYSSFFRISRRRLNKIST